MRQDRCLEASAIRRVVSPMGKFGEILSSGHDCLAAYQLPLRSLLSKLNACFLIGCPNGAPQDDLLKLLPLSDSWTFSCRWESSAFTSSCKV